MHGDEQVVSVRKGNKMMSRTSQCSSVFFEGTLRAQTFSELVLLKFNLSCEDIADSIIGGGCRRCHPDGKPSEFFSGHAHTRDSCSLA